MFLTEEEAAAKVCHRTIGSGEVGSCVGSVCMAWRWHDQRSGTFRVIDAAGDSNAERYGYCGLAGRPA